MPQQTYPNQRLVRVHRERASSDFLGIKNENWMAASRDLGAHALQLYLYLASNANNYLEALSPVAVRQAIGMARSTFHDQFHKLEDKGYLVHSHGNTFDFYEVPPSATQSQKTSSERVHSGENNPATNNANPIVGQAILTENIEINNISTPLNSEINNRTLTKEVIESQTKQPTQAVFVF